MTDTRTTEREVGLLSKLVTKLHSLKATTILELIEEGDLKPAEIVELITTRDIAAIGKWCLDNGVTALPDTEGKENALNKTLDAIRSKSKVVNFNTGLEPLVYDVK